MLQYYQKTSQFQNTQQCNSKCLQFHNILGRRFLLKNNHIFLHLCQNSKLLNQYCHTSLHYYINKCLDFFHNKLQMLLFLCKVNQSNLEDLNYRILLNQVLGCLLLVLKNTEHQNKAILDCAVVGVPDPQTGENIKAFIVLKPEYKGKLTDSDIIEWAKENMAKFKYPRYIEFVAEIPKGTAGKTLRRELRKE